MNENERLVDALENIAAELERLLLLYEFAYGARRAGAGWRPLRGQARGR